MHTRTITIAAGLTLAAGALYWTVSGVDAAANSTAGSATSPSVAGFASATETSAAFGGPDSFDQLPDARQQTRIASVRHTKPLPLVTCEEYWLLVQPIFDTLPHLDKADIHKLRYFCPADFNKDDQIDDQDLALFGTTWSDESSPLFNWCDLNADGIVDQTDAIEFLREFREGPRNCEELKEQRSIIC